MRRLSVHALVATGLVAGALLVGPGLAESASAADLTTCHGKAVTIAVTDPGAAVGGTPGDDVVAIEVTGPRTIGIATGSGNDTVCVHGPAAGIVSTGDGLDDVDTSAMTRAPGLSTPQVLLGPGDDTFLGGEADEIVFADDGLVPPATPGNDTVTTGAGNDQVSGGGGTDVVATGDGDDSAGAFSGAARVDLGAGDDTIRLGSAPLAAVGGGLGTDTIQLDGSRDALAVDDVLQVVTIGGTSTSYTSFESFDVEVGASLAFRGSDAAETLHADRVIGAGAASQGDKALSVDMGGGDDLLAVDQAMTGSWDGGAGTDLLTTRRVRAVPVAGRKPSITVDLGRGGASKVRGSTRTSITSWERLAVDGYQTVSVIGSRRSDTISVSGCRIAVSGGAGSDVIDVGTEDRCGKLPHTSTLRGGAGNDTITGDKGADRLFGDAGNDVLKGRQGRDAAYGGPGRDRCVAERRTSC